MGYALITGASSGIGSELARLFAADGHDLVLVGRREDLLDRLATELESDFRVKAVVMPLDISLLNAPKLIYERVSSKEGYLKYLVNNAGFYVHGPFTETDWEAEAQLIHIQCLNHTRLTKLFLPGMIKAGAGGILNVGSTGSFVPGPYNAVYCAAKAFVLSFSQALAEELKGTGIGVTALCPGGTNTEFHLGKERKKSIMVPLMEPAMVARSGYKAFMKGRRIVIPGMTNKLQVFTSRLLPFGLISRMSASAVKQTS